jgi:D-glycero-D-manno-heptose 1,7-bisphosphate phosphatase
MLLDAARDAGLDLGASYMVGDRWRDIEAGRRAGCATVYIAWGYDERQPSGYNVMVKSLPEAAEWIESDAAGKDA